MSDNINNTNPPSEPLTREEEYLSAIAGVTSSDDIPEKPLTRVEKYLNKIVEDGGGSVYDKLEAGTNINIEETSDGKAKISATGEVSSEDTYAREQIAEHIADKDNPHEVSAADVGLGNCDNTSDLNKPISTATQTALNLKADKTELPEVPITAVKVNNEPLVPASGAVNITVPTQASDVHALADSVKYAGASTAGGSATSAVKLDTASAGSATQPVYFANGIPTATSYSLEKSVPSNAVFTDTTYESKAAASGGTDVSLCTTGEKYTWNSKQNAIDSSHKLSADLVDDTSTTNKFATSAELEQIETNKNNILTVANQTIKYNVCSANSWSMTGTGASPKQIIDTIPIGTYRIIATVNRTDTTKAIQFRVGYTTEMSVGNRVDVLPAVETENYISNEFTLTSPAVCVDFWANTPSDVIQFAIIPKSLYDAGFTNYQPYALPNTKITPELIELVDSGAKNLLNCTLDYLKQWNQTGTWNGNKYTKSNVEVVVNSDGTLTVTANNATNVTDFYLFGQYPNATPVFDYSDNTYVYCNVSDSSNMTTKAFYRTSGVTFIFEVNANTPAVFSSNLTGLFIRVANIGTTYSATTIKPMICIKAAWDVSQKFVPYRPTYEETVEQVAENKNNILSTQTQISYNTNTGVKNLLNNIAISGSQKGVTYTVNADGSVSTSGSTTSDLFILTLGTFTFVQGKTYYITGCPLGGSTTGYSITNIGTTYFYDTGNGATVTGDGQTRTIAIYAPQSGTNMDGLTFKPMIREIGDDTYQPYAMSNAEITAWIKAHT